MKYITLITLILLTTTINGIEWQGLSQGLYINVNYKTYDLYKPLETITNNYIQIDCN